MANLVNAKPFNVSQWHIDSHAATTIGPAVDSLFVADKAVRQSAAEGIASLAKNNGPSAIESTGFTDATIKALYNKKSPAAREGATQAVTALVKAAPCALEPFFIDSGLYAALLETFADKMPTVRAAAVEAVCTYVENANPWGTALLLPALLHEIKFAAKWKIKTGSLTVLNQIIVSAPTQTAKHMPDIVPVLAEAMWDTKADVKKQARDTLMRATALISNKDIEQFIPALINTLINLDEVTKTIQLLSATTFVSEVDPATLSLMIPLLSRGLSEKLTTTKREVAV